MVSLIKAAKSKLTDKAKVVVASAAFAVVSLMTVMSASASTPEPYTFTTPDVPDGTPLFQKMIDMFGTAGTIAMAVIGGAITLAVLVLIARWGWGIFKGWMSKAK